MVGGPKTIAIESGSKLEKPPILISKLAGSKKLDRKINKWRSPLNVIKDLTKCNRRYH